MSRNPPLVHVLATDPQTSLRGTLSPFLRDGLNDGFSEKLTFCEQIMRVARGAGLTPSGDSSCEMDGPDEVGGEIVVEGSDATEIFEAAEHALGDIAASQEQAERRPSIGEHVVLAVAAAPADPDRLGARPFPTANRGLPRSVARRRIDPSVARFVDMDDAADPAPIIDPRNAANLVRKQRPKRSNCSSINQKPQIRAPAMAEPESHSDRHGNLAYGSWR